MPFNWFYFVFATFSTEYDLCILIFRTDNICRRNSFSLNNETKIKFTFNLIFGGFVNLKENNKYRKTLK